jgi:FKBP-type peptidyl-prolyl cis-trans isomerase SlyD
MRRIMKIEKDKVVSIEYKLSVEGNVVDESEGEPLVFLQGHGNVIVGLEAALNGFEPGTETNVSVAPEAGYGFYEEALIQTIPTSSFDDDLEVGGHYTGEDEDGQALSFTVLEIEGEEALVDFNHPLDTLEFWVKVLHVRDATPRELELGQPQAQTVIQA